jgi:hypothetical protein
MSTQLPETFEPENQAGNVWDPLPVGEYKAQIVEASVAQPKSLDGYYIALVWKIIEGDYEGRQVWQRITYKHSSEQAQTIGRKTFKDLCVATEVNEHVENVEMFVFKLARIRVGIERDKEGIYDDKNKVTRILPLTQSAAAGPPPPESPPPTTAQPAGDGKGPVRSGPAGTAPWHQKKS